MTALNGIAPPNVAQLIGSSSKSPARPIVRPAQRPKKLLLLTGNARPKPYSLSATCSFQSEKDDLVSLLKSTASIVSLQAEITARLGMSATFKTFTKPDDRFLMSEIEFSNFKLSEEFGKFGKNLPGFL